MPVNPTYPGVYVQEVPSGVRTITAVGTSTALFLGRTKKGFLNKPIRCFSYTEFVDNFSEDTSTGDMSRFVKLFFLNGGSDCYVMRLANGAQQASVLLQSHDTTARLKFTAKQAGEIGEKIRIAVTYGGRRPEVTFNLQIFRWENDSSGNKVQKDFEEWKGLSMDPNSPLYVVDFVTQESKLVNCTAEGAHTATDGYSIAGRPVSFDNGDPANRVAAWQALAGKFSLSTNGSQYFTVQVDVIDFPTIDTTSIDTVQTDLEGAIASRINDATSIPLGQITVEIQNGPTPPASVAPHNQTDLLKITLQTQNVFVRPASSDDMAVAMMLGAEQGGLEVGAFAHLRPVPTGISLNVSGNSGNVFTSLLALQQSDVDQVTLPELQSDGSLANTNVSVDLETTGTAADPWYVDEDGGHNGLVEKLGLIRDAINEERSARPTTFFWKAELWGNRLAIMPTARDDNYLGSFSTGTTDIPLTITESISISARYYSVGSSGTAGFQTAGDAGNDGSGPQASDYDNAYPIIDSEVDLFNLMILPPDRDDPDFVHDLWGNASVFCQQRRAFLLMDAPSSWSNAQTATNNIASMRMGLVKDYSAIYYPRLVMNEDGREIRIGVSGAMAGLMARIDSSRGVWKAPAGTEADLLGVVGLEQTFSDSENGILNPRAINTIRVFPNGIVSWGARTMDGDDDFASEYKYIPVRRLALFMEESLYRGLKWVVFEPNDEPLWAQIRLNVGAFMHNLFRQGAFQGQTPKDAYFVKCDKETTTQNDINLGIVNIWVGFAPLKPAEFVILYLQQMAGQIEV